MKNLNKYIWGKTKAYIVGRKSDDLISSMKDLRQAVAFLLTEAHERALKGDEINATVEVYGEEDE